MKSARPTVARLTAGQLTLMTRPTEQTKLDLALDYASKGYWVFPLKPGRKVPSTTNGHTDASTDEAIIREWWTRQPNANIGIATEPSGLIIPDLDVKNDDGPANWAELLGQHGLTLHPIVVTTASGGYHHYYRGEPVKGRIGILPSVDVKSQGGYVVAPGSVLDGSDPDRKDVAGDYTGTLPRTDDLPEAPQELRALLAKPKRTATGDSRTDLAGLLANPPEEGRRNDWLARVAGHYIAQHRGDPTAYQALIRQAAGKIPEPLPEEEITKTWESIEARDEENHPDESPSRMSAAETALVFAKQRYNFYVADGEVFAAPKTGPRLLVSIGDRGTGPLKSRLQSDIYDASGSMIGAKSVEDALGMIVAQALTKGERIKVNIRCAEIPGGVVVDLAEPDSARCVVVTREGWEVRDNPPEGVFFRRTVAVKPLPVPQREGASLDPLRETLGWAAEDPRWLLTEGWLVASMRPSIARPLLLFLGISGTAKTTRAKMVLSVLDPRGDLGASFGKNQGDDNTRALAQYLPAWDNVSRVSEATSDWICRLVTGMESIERQLYTNAGAFLMQYRRTGAMTAIHMPHGFKPDAIQRLIPLQCDPIAEEDRLSESQMTAKFESLHPVLLGGLMDAAVIMFRNLPEEPQSGGIRMLDFQVSVRAFKKQTADLLTRKVKETMIEAAEADPFVSTLLLWLNDQRGDIPELSAQEAWEQAGQHRTRVSRDDRHTWWPSAPQHFTRTLDEVIEPLKACGYTVTSRRTKAGKRLQFVRLGDQPQLPTPSDDGDDSRGATW